MKLILLTVILAGAAPVYADDAELRALKARIEQLEERQAIADARADQRARQAKEQRKADRQRDANRLVVACVGRRIDWVSRTCDG